MVLPQPGFSQAEKKASPTILTEAQTPAAEAFRAMRYGLFTTMTYQRTVTPDGKKSYSSLDEFANLFDVNAYADAAEAMGVEYVIFAAWHYAMNNLGPNEALEKWLPGHTAKRDLIGEVADALHKRGIRLIIYAHPNDGHDLKPEEQELVGFIKPESKDTKRLMPKFNDFINEVYADMGVRYASKPNVLGYWLDSWWANGGAIDMPRLRKTLLTAVPHVIILSNWAHPAWIDFRSHECYYNKGAVDDIDSLIARADNQTTVFAGDWVCNLMTNVVNYSVSSHYTPETLYKFTVFNACAGAPGGMAWAISPSADGKTWAAGNLETLRRLGSYVRPIRQTICGVAKSPNWPVPDNSAFSASSGYAATRSLDGTKEYLSVLKAPKGRTLEVSLPKSGVFKSAALFTNGHALKMERTDNALRFTLGEGDAWDTLNTVITLECQ